MTTELANDVTGAPPVGISAWFGVCSGCGCKVQRQKEPKPCHKPRLRCAECKRVTSRKNRKAWNKRNPEYNKGWRQQKRSKAKMNECHKAQNVRSQSTATQSRERWGDVEDVWLLENCASKTEYQLAAELGRSMFAVRMRLWRLRHEMTPNKEYANQPPR